MNPKIISSCSSMTSHLTRVKKSTLTDEIRKVLCEYKNEHPSSTHKILQQWVLQKYQLFIICIMNFYVLFFIYFNELLNYIFNGS